MQQKEISKNRNLTSRKTRERMLFFSSVTWVSIHNNKDKDTKLLDREDKIDLL